MLAILPWLVPRLQERKERIERRHA
jgi:hypothetical protein